MYTNKQIASELFFKDLIKYGKILREKSMSDTVEASYVSLPNPISLLPPDRSQHYLEFCIFQEICLPHIYVLTILTIVFCIWNLYINDFNCTVSLCSLLFSVNKMFPRLIPLDTCSSLSLMLTVVEASVVWLNHSLFIHSSIYGYLFLIFYSELSHLRILVYVWESLRHKHSIKLMGLKVGTSLSLYVVKIFSKLLIPIYIPASTTYELPFHTHQIDKTEKSDTPKYWRYCGKVGLQSWFNLHVFITSKMEHCSCLFPILGSSYMCCWFLSLAHFSIRYFGFFPIDL